MNKYIVSIALLMSAIPGTLVFAENVIPSEERAEGYAVFASPHQFTIETHLTVTPLNVQQWELVDQGGLELIKYEFISSTLVGSAGTQQWIFRARQPGKYSVIFKRNDKTQIVHIVAVQDFLWCGSNPKKPIIITF